MESYRNIIMHNPNSRLEAFCDGVFAIAITLLILDIRIPAMDRISTSQDLWIALKHMLPSVFAFLLSFGIILITWVNHHAILKTVTASSHPFAYANGFLLLTIVFLPFPTALLGEYIFTDHAAPAVVLYSSMNGLQGIGWILLAQTALKGKLVRGEKTILQMRKMKKDALFVLVIYTICTILAFWVPLVIAITITAIWIFWLIYGINIKEE